MMKNTCKARKNRLVFVDKPVNKGTCDFCEVFDYTATDGTAFLDIECGIPGAYQPDNACIAIETAHNLGIEDVFIRSGIKKAKNPGRFEIIQKNPTVIYDGAHNKNGMTALAKCLCRYFSDWQGATFVMAFMGDKDISGEFEILKDNGLLKNSEIFAVKVKDNPRAAEVDAVCDVAKNAGIEAVPFAELKDAYIEALKIGKPVVICGSLYLYKDFDEVLRSL